MIKPVKRNKRLKWIDSHYARFYKARLLLQRCQVAGLLAQGIIQQKLIITSSPRSAGKKTAIANTAINTISSINRILKKPVKGRVTK